MKMEDVFKTSSSRRMFAGIFYCSRANLKNNVKLKLDLTKNRYKIFTRAIETVKSYDNVITSWLTLTVA